VILDGASAFVIFVPAFLAAPCRVFSCFLLQCYNCAMEALPNRATRRLRWKRSGTVLIAVVLAAVALFYPRIEDSFYLVQDCTKAKLSLPATYRILLNEAISRHYSERAFRAIVAGANQDSVRQRLGDPLIVIRETKGRQTWYYTAPPQTVAGRVRAVAFDADGNVKNTISEFWDGISRAS
jgi:outer membrane protein assembly factor BamE (lipoprotein component of BamABCDE complex)